MINTGININDGISQEERYFSSLDPEYFKIDDRTAEEIILFFIELSFQYNYFNDQNDEVLNWSEFFVTDPDLMLRLFRKEDFQNFYRSYSMIKEEVLLAENKEYFFNKLNEIITKTIDPPLDLHDRMYNLFTTAINQMDDDYSALKSFIPDSDSEFNYKKWEEYEKYVNLKMEIDNHRSDVNNNDNFFVQIKDNLEIFDGLFKQLEIKNGRLLSAAGRFKQQREQKNITFQPHIGLVLAFSELYQSVKEELNGLTRKHLDFYFKKMLDFKPIKAIPDKVAVILNLHKNINELLLLKGEKILCKGAGAQKSETYSLLENQWISQAKVMALKTVYKSGFEPTGNLRKAKKEFIDNKIYAAEMSVPDVEDLQKAGNINISYPVFGEEQRYLPPDEKTMFEAELGMMIASPVLFAADGKREFTIEFQLNNDAFKTYFIGYAIASEQRFQLRPRVLLAEILKKAFVISITGMTGWIRIAQYSATYSAFVRNKDGLIDWKEIADYADKYSSINQAKKALIKIRFVLDKDDPSVSVFQPAIHGSGYTIKRPVLKLMLNNASFLHPYALLFKQVIESITVRVAVKDSVRLNLLNNIGQLSSSNSFPLFGPLPSVGSFLAIKNTNIFNRFTKQAGIKLNWVDLPRLSGGFRAYYDGYGNNVQNESFKVAFSGLVDGQYLPKRGIQESLNLFHSNDNLLEETTSFENILSYGMRFENEPLLNKENTTGSDFKEGAVRMELLAPEDGFCQKLYPVMLPEILINNAKWYHKKLPVPNQPFIPIVSSVSVDYVLEHTEKVFGKNESVEQCDIELWHIYPFGYRKRYPREINEDIIFIPVIDKKSNLFIALSDVTPGNELSILFQIEENNVRQLKDHDSKLKWSYLCRNEWKDFHNLDLLEDNTINFKGPGIVRLKMPYDISNGNTLFDSRYYWIRVSSDEYIESRIRAVFAQAVTFVRDLDNGVDNKGVLRLDPFMIKEFSRKIPEISNIYQPFYSYHGCEAESDEKFYARASERLRHKQRLITNSDISQKILELFPEIDTVMCFSRTEMETETNNDETNMIKITVIRKLKYVDDKKIIRPLVNVYTLYKVKKFTSANLSPFIKDENIDVCNPDYEILKVFCTVSFKKNIREIRNSLTLQDMNRAICKFISPWLFSTLEKIDPEKNIYPSQVFNFIKNLPYIESVGEFKIVHFYKKEESARIIDSNVFASVYKGGKPFLYEQRPGEKNPKRKLFFRRSKPGAVITTADEHSIILLDNTDKDISGKEEIKTGIGQLSIGSEFLVMDSYKVTEYPGVEISKTNADNELNFNFQIKS